MKILRTSEDITITLQTLNQSLPTILKNLEEITTNINNSTAAVNRRIQNFSNTADRSQLIISDIIDNIQCFAPIAMKLPIFQTIRNVAAVIKGIRVFIDVLLNKEKV
jgi:methyl-accepting chemotaxis protein